MPRLLVAILVAALATTAAATPTCLGPTPYVKKADSPFDLSGVGSNFFFDDFEGPNRVTGVTPSAGSRVGFPDSIIDSVDEDDGTIDGSGLMGHSWFSGDGAGGVTWTFDTVTLGGYPTAAGIVWTDGAPGSSVFFQAIGADGVTVLCDSGPQSDPGVFPDNSNNGETAEDRFFGVYEATGISSIKLWNPGGGIEMDHIQFGAVALATTTTTTITTTTVTTTTVTTTTTTTVTTTTVATTTTTTVTTTTHASTTTTTAHATTTTTLPSGECTDEATFESILCRLDALIADVQSARGDLGRLENGIENAVKKARKQAATASEAGTGKKPKNQLKKCSKSLRTFEHKLDSNNAHRIIPQGTRDALRGDSAAIRTDVDRLRGTL